MDDPQARMRAAYLAAVCHHGDLAAAAAGLELGAWTLIGWRTDPAFRAAEVIAIELHKEEARPVQSIPTRYGMIGLDETGHPIGEDHGSAKLTDLEVDEMRTLHEEEGLGLKRLAQRFKISRRAVQKIVRYETRNQHAASWKSRKPLP